MRQILNVLRNGSEDHPEAIPAVTNRTKAATVGSGSWLKASDMTALRRVLEVVSFGESAVASDGAGDGREGQEVFRLALVAAMEPPASREPGHGALYLLTVTAQSLRGLDALACDALGDAPLT